MTSDYPIEYRSRPFICGAIGRCADSNVDQLLAAAPAELEQQPAAPGVRLFVSDQSLLHRSSAGYTWTATRGSDRSDSLSVRLSWGESRVALATDPFGLNELYFRRTDGGVLFATRIRPLVMVGEDGVSTDWEAWADIVAFGYPLGDRTPFLEVRRMVAGSEWVIEDGAEPKLRNSPWDLLPSGHAVEPDTMVAIVSQNIPRMSVFKPIVLLSGGWDSRMLAGLTRSRSVRRPVAWTTSPDDGWDHDVSLAIPVARALGIKHRIHIPGEDAYRQHATATRQRVQYQTYMHTWLRPLANVVNRTRSPLLDGLAGDVLLKSLFVDETTSETRDRSRRMERVKKKLAIPLDNKGFVHPKFCEFTRDANATGFSQAIEPIPDFPGDATIAVLLTRTMRGIAPSPLWVFGPEADVRLPFVDSAVIAAALTVPIGWKANGSYYRQVLSHAASAAALLPSTNDPLGTIPRSFRRQTRTEALVWMAGLIASSNDAIDMLTPRLATAVLDDPEDLIRLGQLTLPVRVLQAASTFAEWQSEFRWVLTDIGRAPWSR